MTMPIEADFEVTKADDTRIEVTFRPTESRYTFGRQEPSGEGKRIARLSLVQSQTDPPSQVYVAHPT